MEINKMKILINVLIIFQLFNKIHTQNITGPQSTILAVTTPDPVSQLGVTVVSNPADLNGTTTTTTTTQTPLATLPPNIIYPGFQSVPPYNFVPEVGVCQSITIMNNVSDFKQLEGCHKIEGFLHIIDLTANTLEYSNLSFPLLTEVTYYIAIVHARGLKTLGNIFPNLSVIRGDVQLIKGYSLIIYENNDLEDLGLQSLKYIGRGAVRIDSNPKLCHADTIDWSKIAPHSSISFHFIQNNKPFNCTPCQPFVQHPQSQEICANAVNSTYSFYKDKRVLCWNSTACQRLCPVECKTKGCSLYGECCHDQCLGGCSQPNSPNHCNACMNKIYNGQCVESCPESTVSFNSRRCITHDNCKLQMRQTSQAIIYKEKINQYPYFTFEGECVYKCPEHYTISHSNAMITCASTLPPTETLRKCSGGIIKTLADVHKFRDCYHVQGSITIDSDNHLTTAKLEEGIKKVRIIDGYFAMIGTHGTHSPKTFRSLSNLRLIKGEELYQNKYAIFMLFNENLSSLFTHSVEIKRGSLFFAMNPSLCSSRIRKTQQLLTERSGSCCDTVDIGNDKDC